MENCRFIPDTSLRITKVLPVIICGGEVTGNNWSCCLFAHSMTSQRSQIGFWSGADTLAVGQVLLLVLGLDFCRLEYSFLIYYHVHPFPRTDPVLSFFRYFSDQTKTSTRMLGAYMCTWDWIPPFLRDQSFLCYQLSFPNRLVLIGMSILYKQSFKMYTFLSFESYTL